jgi:hypothetical protein
LITLLAPYRAGAQDSPITPPVTAGPILADTAVPIASGHFALQPFFGLSCTRGNFTPGWRRTSAGGDFTSFVTVLRLTYGPLENMEIYAEIPAIQNWAGRLNRPVAGNRTADFGGLGDITLVGKYQLCTETERRPTITPSVSGS